MSDVAAVGLCVAVGLATYFAIPLPITVCALAIAVAVCFRCSATLFVACAVAASTMSAYSWSKLDAPLDGEVSGIATLRSDPTYMFGAQRATASLDGRRYQLWVRKDADVVRPLLAGDRIHVVGKTSKLSGLGAPSQRRKHVAAKLEASRVVFVDHGNVMARFTNAIHKQLADTTSQLPQRQAALAMGMTVGDDRQLDAATVEEFRDANLAHLTAVSGANVAFFIVLFAPLLLSMQLRGRIATTLLLLFVFGVLTRWEASVVRAELMAGVVLIAYGLGRPISALRAIALGSTAAMLIDPFLVGSIGFLLSVSACVGMAGLAQPVARLLFGPKWLKQGIGFAVAAQVGVAPIQLTVFGTLPAVGILANVAAGPLAGALMGLTAIAAFGSLFGSWTGLLLVPVYGIASLLLWIAQVASSANWGSWSFDKLISVVIVWSAMSLAATTFDGRGRSSSRLFRKGRRRLACKPGG